MRQYLLSPAEVLAGYDAVLRLHPHIPPLFVWRAWEYAAYRRYTLAEPVLDVGCGDGRFFRLVWPHIRQAVGVDIAPTVTLEAQRSGVYRAVYVASADQLPVPNAYFGSVFANCALEHMNRLPAVLQSIAHCLRPGGTFVLSVVTDKFLDWTMLPLVAELLGDRARPASLQSDYITYHHLVNPLSVPAWIEQLTAAGLEVKQHIPIVPEITGRFFLLLDQLWHLPRGGGELGDTLPSLFAGWPNFEAGAQQVLQGLLHMEPDWHTGCGAVFYAYRPGGKG